MPHITPASPHVGAFVSQLNLSQAQSLADAAAIRAALAAHGVLFFRGQHISPQQQLAFASSLGPVVVNRFFKPVEGHPEIAEVRKEPTQRHNIGGGWHTDHSYDEAPALGSLLLARELPPLGGDTLFASMGAAYDALSPALQRTLCGLRAVHGSAHVFGAGGGYAALAADMGGRVGNTEAANQEVVHPMVVRHPDSGRAVLYVNPAFTLRIEGWSKQESEPLLKMLYEHAARPEFSYRLQWEPGTMALWDNRATWHNALNDYHGHRRVMHRITVQGVALQAWAA